MKKKVIATILIGFSTVSIAIICKATCYSFTAASSYNDHLIEAKKATVFSTYQDQAEQNAAYTFCLANGTWESYPKCTFQKFPLPTGCTSNGTYSNVWYQVLKGQADSVCTGWYLNFSDDGNAIPEGTTLMYVNDNMNCGE
ncbi:MAG TPA: hypothetical protein VH280_12735 [Verrucomicrobiae bacterium]|jgi:hypothetical protein|nr:hypothetical protein [Verrucomicrobiae bacterium]